MYHLTLLLLLFLLWRKGYGNIINKKLSIIKIRGFHDGPHSLMPSIHNLSHIIIDRSFLDKVRVQRYECGFMRVTSMPARMKKANPGALNGASLEKNHAAHTTLQNLVRYSDRWLVSWLVG